MCHFELDRAAEKNRKECRVQICYQIHVCGDIDRFSLILVQAAC